MTDLSNKVTALYRYPFKGLTGEQLSSVMLEPGKTLPFDRSFAFENGEGRFDPANPKHLPKTNFLMLMRHEKLAALAAHFEDDSQRLTLKLNGEIVAQGYLNTAEGRAELEDFINHYMDDKDLRGHAHIVQATNHSFSDVAAQCLHIINLASLREVEKVMNKPLNPQRFRANIYLDGLKPWEEFNWMDDDIQFGDATLHVFQRTVRCFATNVDPQTAQRDDTNIPTILKEHFGHSDLGIYATVIKPGLISAPPKS